LSRTLKTATSAAAITAALVFVAAGCSGGEQNAPNNQDSGLEGSVRVTRVIDGDTVVTNKLGKVRLIGINTPEEGKCYDTEATRFTRRRLDGKRVSYELGVERKDRYGRTLAYLSRGEMHNLALARRGYAAVLTIPPNEKYAERFEAAVREAKQQDDGRWGVCPRRRREALARKRAREAEAERAREERAAARRATRRAARQAAAARRRTRSRRSGSSSSSGSGSIPKNCSGVNGPIPTPPGDPTNLDGNDDGVACE